MRTVEMCNQGAVKGILQLPTCKNNIILDYYGVWRTYTVSFTHGYVRWIVICKWSRDTRV